MKLPHTSLRGTIRDHLRQRIVTGQLAPGEALREPALATELGVSRSPLREALVTLESEGLLASEVHRGFTVRTLSEQAIGELYPILGALEGLAIRLGGDRLRERLPSLRRLNADLRRPKCSARTRADLDLRFHQELGDACDNPQLIAVREGLRGRARLFDRVDERGVAEVQRSCDDHDRVLDAIEQGHLGRAARLTERHWESGIQVVVDWLRANRADGGDGRGQGA